MAQLRYINLFGTDNIIIQLALRKISLSPGARLIANLSPLAAMFYKFPLNVLPLAILHLIVPSKHVKNSSKHANAVPSHITTLLPKFSIEIHVFDRSYTG